MRLGDGHAPAIATRLCTWSWMAATMPRCNAVRRFPASLRCPLMSKGTNGCVVRATRWSPALDRLFVVRNDARAEEHSHLDD